MSIVPRKTILHWHMNKKGGSDMRENSLLKAFTDIFHKALSFLKRILSSPVGRRKLFYGFLKKLLILYLLFWVYAFIAYPEFVPRSLAHLPELSLILPCLFSLILALPLFPPIPFPHFSLSADILYHPYLPFPLLDWQLHLEILAGPARFPVFL